MSLVDSWESLKEKATKGGWKGWMWGALAAIVGVVAIAIFAWVTARKNGELARLKHERDLQEAEAERAHTDSQVAELDEEKQAALERVDVAEKEISRLEEEIGRIEEEQNEATDRINQIKSWDDVDSYLDHRGDDAPDDSDSSE